MDIDTVTSHVSDEDQPYEHFKETNWWARSWLFPALFFSLFGVCFVSYALKADIETKAQAYALLGYTVAAIIVPLLLLIVIKHFAHDRAWKKYKEEWNMGTGDDWSENVGDALKIKY